MAAPKGNKFWQIRTEHGRKKLFSTPAILWGEAVKYFEWVDENPFIEFKPMSISNGNGQGSNIELIEVPVKRPYTWEGLEIFLDISSLRNYKTDENYKDFMQVIGQIEKTIYSNKFTGAASGFFNANIIARDLGLVDKQQSSVNMKVKGPEGLTDEELAEQIKNAEQGRGN
jgi:hypothetical protein